MTIDGTSFARNAASNGEAGAIHSASQLAVTRTSFDRTYSVFYMIWIVLFRFVSIFGGLVLVSFDLVCFVFFIFRLSCQSLGKHHRSWVLFTFQSGRLAELSIFVR